MVGWESFIVYLSAALPAFVMGVIVGRNSKSKAGTPSASHNKQSTPCLCKRCPSFKQCVGGEKFDAGNGL